MRMNSNVVNGARRRGGRARACRAAAILGLLGVPVVARAQDPVSGILEGTVRTVAGAPLDGARITAVGGGPAVVVMSDRTGGFRVAFLPPGEYDVTVERLGYRPLTLTGVPVRPGRRLRLPLELAPAAPPVRSGYTRPFEVRAFGNEQTGMATWYDGGLLELPDRRRDLGMPGRLSSLAGPGLDVEGLPPELTAIAVDGFPIEPARQPRTAAAPVLGAPFPLAAIGGVELVTNGVDAEWAGLAGAVLSAHTRRGTGRFHADAFGTWSNQALASSSRFDVGQLPHDDLRGGFSFGGPLLRDSVHYFVAVEGRRARTPLPGAWDAAGAEALLAVAADSFGIALDPYRAPRLATTDALSAFARLDWRISDAHALSARAGWAILPAADLETTPLAGDPASLTEGRDLAADVTFTSALRPRIATQLRVGAATSRRVWGDAAGLGADSLDLPRTLIVDRGLDFGLAPGVAGTFERAMLQATGTVHYRSGNHWLKFGGGINTASHDAAPAPDRGVVLFGDLDAFAHGIGVFTGAGAASRPTAFRTGGGYGFLQDVWTPRPGLELTAGLRLDSERYPAGDVVSNTDWLALTGLDNRPADRGWTRLNPRFGLVWDVQDRHRWVVRAAAGAYSGTTDPLLLSELIAGDGRDATTRIVGDLGGWPHRPAPALGSQVPGLAILGPDFQAPRTLRFSAGMSRHFGAAGALHLSAAFRRTDFLPRRADLNLSPAPATTDQYGRPVYGSLTRQGALLAALPGSGRRFSTFDRVSALTATGRSEQLRATATIEWGAGGPLHLLGSYTWSRTIDDLIGAAAASPDARFHPFPHAAGEDWAEARSDFDVPHRLVLAGVVDAPRGLRIAALYRYDAGRPFTPGFRDGVDANGDGSGTNDPAFIDPALPGMDALLATWDCLHASAGDFAERNACRAPGTHALDLRASVRLFAAAGMAGTLFVDALDLLDSGFTLTDRALLLVEPGAGLDAHDSGIRVPLVVNPRFGKPLARTSTARALRVGFSIHW
jgi:hypothetical protein